MTEVVWSFSACLLLYHLLYVPCFATQASILLYSERGQLCSKTILDLLLTEPVAPRCKSYGYALLLALEYLLAWVDVAQKVVHIQCQRRQLVDCLNERPNQYSWVFSFFFFFFIFGKVKEVAVAFEY